MATESLNTVKGMTDPYSTEITSLVLDVLLKFSYFELVILLVGLGLFFSTLLPIYVRHRFSIAIPDGLIKGAEESIRVIAGLCVLLIAFCLIRAQGDHRAVEDVVAREATVMIKLHRAFHSFGGEEGDILKKNLLTYSETIIDNEWSLLKEGKRSDLADAQLGVIALQTKSLDPKSPKQQISRSEILVSFGQLSDLREARISAAKVKLPDYLWGGVLAALTTMLVIGWMINPLFKLLTQVGGCWCGLMVLLSMLITTVGHVNGPSAVTPAQILDAHEVMSTHLEESESDQK